MRKKLLAITLCVMVAVSCMPTLAFAANEGTCTNHYHSEVAADSKDIVEITKAPTCTEKGEATVKCAYPNCDGVAKKVAVTALGHQNKEVRYNSPAELYDALTAYNATTYLIANKAAWVKANDFCVAWLNTCTVCGYVNIDAPDMAADEICFGPRYIKHAAYTGATNCLETYECSVCKRAAVKTTGYDSKAHTFSGEKTKLISKDTDCSNTQAYETYDVVCDLCGTPRGIVASYIKKEITRPATACAPTGDAWTEDPSNVPGNEGKVFFKYTDNKYYQYEVTVAPKCYANGTTTDGKAVLKCKNCGKVLDEKNIAATHTMGTEVTVEATCLMGKHVEQSCTVCGYKYVGTESTHALSHQIATRNIVKPTCEAAGSFEVYCKVCGCSEVVDNATEGAPINAVKFTKDGNGVAIAEALQKTEGIILDYQIKAPISTATLGHKFSGEYVEFKPATCTVRKVLGHKCATCEKFDATSLKYDGEALGHDFTRLVAPATCENKAKYGCSRCDAPAVGGEATGVACKFTVWTVKVQPTVFDAGYEYLTCEVCGNVDTDKWHALDARALKASEKSTVKAGSKKVTVTVKAVAGAKTYKVYVGGKLKKTTTAAGKVTVKGLKKGKKYAVKVYAYNATGKSVKTLSKNVKVK